MRRVILLVISIVLFSASAEACLPVPLSDKACNSIKDSAYLIGQVKLLSSSDEKEATYEVITPYKTSKNFSSKIIKIKRNAISSCDRSFGKIGTIYEEIFFDHGLPEVVPIEKNKDNKNAIPIPRKFGIDIAEKSNIFSNDEFWKRLRKRSQIQF